MLLGVARYGSVGNTQIKRFLYWRDQPAKPNPAFDYLYWARSACWDRLVAGELARVQHQVLWKEVAVPTRA